VPRKQSLLQFQGLVITVKVGTHWHFGGWARPKGMDAVCRARHIHSRSLLLLCLDVFQWPLIHLWSNFLIGRMLLWLLLQSTSPLAFHDQRSERGKMPIMCCCCLWTPFAAVYKHPFKCQSCVAAVYKHPFKYQSCVAAVYGHPLQPFMNTLLNANHILLTFINTLLNANLMLQPFMNTLLNANHMLLPFTNTLCDPRPRTRKPTAGLAGYWQLSYTQVTRATHGTMHQHVFWEQEQLAPKASLTHNHQHRMKQKPSA